MRRQRFLPSALIGLVLVLNACVLFSQPIAPKVEANDLDELSGLTVSNADSNVLWGHNDSGDLPRLFRMTPLGKDLGYQIVHGAYAVDWEDIASFSWQGEPALLVADTGDNRGTRDHVSLYAVHDPGARGELKLLWALDFRYPDGPRDCEAVAVDPIDNAVILISKREHPQHLYRIPIPKKAPIPGEIVTAALLGTVSTLPRSSYADLLASPLYTQFDGPTALDIAHSGRFAIITTYKDAYLYRRAKGQKWLDVFAAQPETVRLPHLEQTEAGAISNDDTALFVSGEGAHPPLARVPLPAR